MNSAFGASSCLCQPRGGEEKAPAAGPPAESVPGSPQRVPVLGERCDGVRGSALLTHTLHPHHGGAAGFMLNLLQVHVKGTDQRGSLILNTHHPLDHDHDLKRMTWEWICQIKCFRCTVPGCLGSSLGSTIYSLCDHSQRTSPICAPVSSSGKWGS